MSNITHIEGNIYLESVPSFSQAFSAESELVVANSLRGVIASGGCYVLNITPEAKELLVASQELSEASRQAIACLSPGYYIQLFEELFQRHNAQERQAVIEHELGHIHRGHLLDTVSERNECGFLDRLDYELQADSDAARKTSKEAMRAGLLKSVYASARLSAKVLAFQGEHDRAEDMYAQALAHPPLVARLEALS